MELNLTGQEAYAQNIQPEILTLKSLMNDRKVVWDKISNAKKKAWITSDKDPIMSLAWSIYSWLDNNFFEDYDHGDD